MNALHRQSSTPRGFTLVETLVAIAILMIAIAGPYYSLEQAILSSYIARDQLIASSLAQEGVEYVYFVRDSNYLPPNSANWLQGLDACRIDSPYNNTNGCTIDPSQTNPGTAIAGCPTSGCTPLTMNPANNLYVQDVSYPATRFTRTVTIQNITPTEVKVTVSVSWFSHVLRTVTVTETLYNWL